MLSYVCVQIHALVCRGIAFVALGVVAMVVRLLSRGIADRSSVGAIGGEVASKRPVAVMLELWMPSWTDVFEVEKALLA